ncbi:hypothetical protein SAMN05444156_1843 [Verrucomicrobium sp. GAS474]|uniref:hybrid sensor histidine kinase/response regulator n=1 Tax=Verrucomicrobium sp. GAS474 TaxID=1882831 RepID=UPI00087BC7B3|nr:hybrid sensor histidine kinase/response regulator [Verrucomicrobium sp. GAS474]SDU08035.1 hypothetical protein SAMN05444156_1843 [Verrucomicrobium sp. GAS474]
MNGHRPAAVSIPAPAQAQTQAHEIASLHQAILSSASLAIISTRLDGVVTTFNQTAERWLGHSAAEVVGLQTPALWHDGEEVAARAGTLSVELGRKIEPGFEAFVARLGGGRTDEQEWTLVRKDGSRFPARLAASELTNADGVVVGYLGLLSDLSQQKEMERELEKNRTRIRSILSNSLDGVVSFDAIRDEAGTIRDFLFTLINPAAERISRITAAEIIGKRLLEVFPTIVADGLFAKYVSIVETGKPLEFEYLSRRHESPRWYRVAGTKVNDGFSVNYIDITDRKQFEAEILKLNDALETRVEHRTRELSESERRARFLAETMPQIIWTARGDGVHDYHNQRWYAYTGLTEEETRNGGWERVLHPDDRPESLERWTAALRDGTDYEAEYRFRRASDGAYRWHLGRAFPLRDDRGEIALWIGTCTDIDDLKRADEKVRQANEDLERRVLARTAELHEKNIDLESAAKAKNRFLTTMSHELRTPLNCIIGFSELLVDGRLGGLNKTQKEYLDDILASGNHLLQLINDVLDLAKVEAGKIEIVPDTFLLRDAVSQVCSVIHSIVLKNQLRFTTLIAPELGAATLDYKMFKQVLYNLLSNAVKFTKEKGSVTLRIDPAGADRFTVTVEDTGIGIREENLPRLFREFEQLDDSLARQHQGTGLGLALTRRLTEAHGGTIAVASEFGKGSTFTVTLPLVFRPA